MGQFPQAFEKMQAREFDPTRRNAYAVALDDRGGETYKGISRIKQPHWPGWVWIDEGKQKVNFPDNLETDTRIQTAHRDFFRGLWSRFDLDGVKSQVLAEIIFDTAVNMGPSRVTFFLQRAMNALNLRGERWPDVHEDGVIGEETLAVMRRLGKYETTVAKAIGGLRIAYAIDITRADPSQETNAAGWIDRVSFEGIG